MWIGGKVIVWLVVGQIQSFASVWAFLCGKVNVAYIIEDCIWI